MTGDLGPAAALATQLRQAGVRTQLYTEQKKFKQKMTYADRIGVPYVLFLGDDEIAQGTVSVKDMATGEQVALLAAEAAGVPSKGARWPREYIAHQRVIPRRADCSATRYFCGGSTPEPRVTFCADKK